MARKHDEEPSAPASARPAYDRIVALTDAFCREHLNAEYESLCRKLAAALARKRPSPLSRGKPEVGRVRISLVILAGAMLALAPLGSGVAPTTGRVPDARKARTSDWPRWRGPNADGVVEGGKLPVRWSKTENILWSVKLPGWGTSSPVVYGNRVFVTSQEAGGGKKALLTLCFDQQSGKELWRLDFGFGVDQRTHKKSNLAVNTLATRLRLPAGDTST